MDTLNIEAGTKTPKILLGSNGVIELKGKSIPENSVEYYKPVFEWLDSYAKQPSGKTEVLIQMEYFNTSSSKCILDIFRKLESIHKSGKSSVNVTWVYDPDDEDMMETGEDYQTLVNVPFRIMKNDE
jgi:hypothetical protein